MAILARPPKSSTVEYSILFELAKEKIKKPTDQAVLNVEIYSFKGELHLGRVLIIIQNGKVRIRY